MGKMGQCRQKLILAKKFLQGLKLSLGHVGAKTEILPYHDKHLSLVS